MVSCELFGSLDVQLQSPGLYMQQYRMYCGVHGELARKRQTNLSLSRLSGYFDPGGKSGLSSDDVTSGTVGLAEIFDEFPAFPDFTMPFPERGAI
jgi:hypothetical protein